MEDPELAAIRAARMNQLQQNAPAQASGGNDEAAKRASDEEMRRSVLARILDHEARERRTPIERYGKTNYVTYYVSSASSCSHRAC